MATKAEIQAQIDALTASMDDADGDDEVWVKDESGREFKFTGSRAGSIIEKFGDLFAPAAAAGDGKDGKDGGAGAGGDAGGKDKKPADGGGYFGRKGK